MPGEDTLKRGKHCLALLLERGEVAPQTTEGDRAGGTAETAGDLLLDFDHAQVAFRLIVVEGHAPIGHEGQHLLLVAAQAIKEVAALALLGPTAFLWPG